MHAQGGGAGPAPLGQGPNFEVRDSATPCSATAAPSSPPFWLLIAPIATLRGHWSTLEKTAALKEVPRSPKWPLRASGSRSVALLGRRCAKGAALRARRAKARGQNTLPCSNPGLAHLARGGPTPSPPPAQAGWHGPPLGRTAREQERAQPHYLLPAPMGGPSHGLVCHGVRREGGIKGASGGAEQTRDFGAHACRHASRAPCDSPHAVSTFPPATCWRLRL